MEVNVDADIQPEAKLGGVGGVGDKGRPMSLLPISSYIKVFFLLLS
jgi:hypothetical protein